MESTAEFGTVRALGYRINDQLRRHCQCAAVHGILGAGGIRVRAEDLNHLLAELSCSHRKHVRRMQLVDEKVPSQQISRESETGRMNID